MANKEFFIYTDRNKLLTPSSTEYRVQKPLKAKELKPAIRGEHLIALLKAIFSIILNVLVLIRISACKEELDLEGAQAIFKNFDKLFSVIELIEQLDYPNLHYVFDEILVKSKLNCTNLVILKIFFY